MQKGVTMPGTMTFLRERHLDASNFTWKSSHERLAQSERLTSAAASGADWKANLEAITKLAIELHSLLACQVKAIAIGGACHPIVFGCAATPVDCPGNR